MLFLRFKQAVQSQFNIILWKVAMKSNIFEQASRLNLDFQTAESTLYVSDLWNLPLLCYDGKTSLDALAKKYYRILRDTEITSFVVNDPAVNILARLRFDILLHIIKVKKNEQFELIRQKEANARREKIMELIERKQNDALTAAYIDELRSVINAL